ncbi:MAG: hypothetical protein U0271_27120 [Polyangiaceae bacterium]
MSAGQTGLVGSLCLFITASAAGCGSSTKSTSTAETDPQTSSATTASSDPAPSASSKPTSTVTTQRSDPSRSKEREITVAECHMLATKYGELTRVEQRAKVSDKLSVEKKNEVYSQIEEAVKTLSERWEKSCNTDLAGKFTLESSLDCAMASKSVSALEVCLSGGESPP